MQAFTKLTVSLILIALSTVVPAAAHAGVTVEADVVVTDDAGGTLTLISSATHELAGSNVLTTADFEGFRPKPDGRTLDGEIVRVRNRDVESIEATYDGSLDISGPAAEDGIDTLQLDGLTVLRNRDGQGPELSGTVVFNGQSFDADELPDALAGALRRVLRLFHFA
ncbi:MAG: hypothetical protein GVY32_06730 [Gammaproteobacteria bacterium]|jgi:hypothetical protein|nr:hypothetical protein [Gammaproteobacteria bacterium]